jgi:hypothetical protein
MIKRPRGSELDKTHSFTIYTLFGASSSFVNDCFVISQIYLIFVCFHPEKLRNGLNFYQLIEINMKQKGQIYFKIVKSTDLKLLPSLLRSCPFLTNLHNFCFEPKHPALRPPFYAKSTLKYGQTS